MERIHEPMTLEYFHCRTDLNIEVDSGSRGTFGGILFTPQNKSFSFIRFMLWGNRINLPFISSNSPQSSIACPSTLTRPVQLMAIMGPRHGPGHGPCEICTSYLSPAIIMIQYTNT